MEPGECRSLLLNGEIECINEENDASPRLRYVGLALARRRPARGAAPRGRPRPPGGEPAAAVADHVVATYFFAFRTQTLEKAVEEISYHATSGIKNPPTGSLLEQCSAQQAGVDAFDASGRIGLLHVAFPLKMMRQPDGHLTSCDLLHTVAGAVIFDVYENQDARLIALQIPDEVLAHLPRPGLRPARASARRPASPLDQPAFGTILKPTAGITPDDVERLVGEVAGSPLLMFIKEDEDLYPNLDYSPVAERTRRAIARDRAGARPARAAWAWSIAPHVSGGPERDRRHGPRRARGGRLGRHVQRDLRRRDRPDGPRGDASTWPNPPAIYGHNAGIGVKTRAIWREVIDFLARLDGIDFRQTAPVRPGTPFIRPYGAEWHASEDALTRPIARHQADDDHPRRGARPGEHHPQPPGRRDARASPRTSCSWPARRSTRSRTRAGSPTPASALEAMLQAIDVHRSGELRRHADRRAPRRPVRHSPQRKKLTALTEALRQRYPGKVA